MAAADRQQLLARGRLLELVTLGWNVVGIVVLAIAAVSARSVALAGFGLDSLIEIGASTAVLWELADIADKRQLRAMRLIGGAFVALALYLAVQSTVVLVAGFHPRHSALGIVWTAVTAGAMFLLSRGKAVRVPSPPPESPGQRLQAAASFSRHVPLRAARALSPLYKLVKARFMLDTVVPVPARHF